jgi:diguanylate cyclase (GGDEF)-like protein
MVLPRRARWFVLAVTTAGYTCAAVALAWLPLRFPPAYFLTFLLTLVLARARVSLGPESASWLSATTTGIFFSLFSFGLGPTLLLAGLATWAFSVGTQTSSGGGLRSTFNVANVVTSLMAAGLVAQVTDVATADETHVTQVLAAALTYHFVNSTLLAVVVSLARQTDLAPLWHDTYRTSIGPAMVCATSGATGALMIAHGAGNPLVTVLIVVPALLVYRSYTREAQARALRIRELEEALHAAGTDALTGLPNRRAFTRRSAEELDRARRACQSVTVLLIDLDRFKTLNDTLGHAAGDAVLQEVARRLRASVRIYDVAARLAGDEFVALLPNCPREAGDDRRRDLQEQLGRVPVVLGQDSWTIDASIGCAVYPEEGHDLDTLLAAADASMYADKHARKAAA